MFLSFFTPQRFVFQTPPAQREILPATPAGSAAVSDSEYRKRYEFTKDYLQSILDESLFADVNLKDIDANARAALKEAAKKALQEIEQNVTKPEMVDILKDENDFNRKNLALMEEILDRHLGNGAAPEAPKPEPAFVDVLAADIEAREDKKYVRALDFVLGEAYDNEPSTASASTIADAARTALQQSTLDSILKIPSGKTFRLKVFNLDFQVAKNPDGSWKVDAVNQQQYDENLAYVKQQREKERPQTQPEPPNNETIVAMREDGSDVTRQQLFDQINKK